MLKFLFLLFFTGLFILGSIGYVLDWVKLCHQSFDGPSYKAEILYGVGAFTGAGIIIGWADIKDN
jgi:hypothetical protein